MCGLKKIMRKKDSVNCVNGILRLGNINYVYNLCFILSLLIDNAIFDVGIHSCYVN